MEAWSKGVGTYTKVLDVAQHLVVQGKVIARDDIDASVLLDLPVGKPEPLGLGEELGLREFASPVCTSRVNTGQQPLYFC